MRCDSALYNTVAHVLAQHYVASSIPHNTPAHTLAVATPPIFHHAAWAGSLTPGLFLLVTVFAFGVPHTCAVAADDDAMRVRVCIQAGGGGGVCVLTNLLVGGSEVSSQ